MPSKKKKSAKKGASKSRTLPPEILRSIVQHVRDLEMEEPEDDLDEIDSDGEEDEDADETTRRLFEQFVLKDSGSLDTLSEKQVVRKLEELKKTGKLDSLMAEFEESLEEKRKERGDTHKWEEWGEHRYPILEALSRTSKTFHEIVAPFLWETIDLENRSILDLLYLHQVILPRHAQHIKSLAHINPSDSSSRPRIPTYITSALHLPPQSDTVSSSSSSKSSPASAKEEYPESERADVKLLSGELLPSPNGTVQDAAKKGEKSRMLYEAQTEGVIAQRQKLVDLLVKDLPNVEEVELIWDGEDERALEHFRALTKAFCGGLGGKIKSLVIETSGDLDAQLGSRHSFNATSQEEAITSLLSLLPNLVKVNISVNHSDVVDPPSADPETTSPLAAALRSRTALEELRIYWAGGIDSSFFMGEDAELGSGGVWKCPLRDLSLEGPRKTPVATLVAFLSQFPKLESLSLLPPRYIQEDSDPSDTPIQSLDLRHLKILTFPHGIYPIRLFDLFVDSPLETIYFDQPIAYSELKLLLKKHELTLKEVSLESLDEEGELTDAEKLELMIWAEEKGVVITHDGFILGEEDEEDEDFDEGDEWEDDDDGFEDEEEEDEE